MLTHKAAQQAARERLAWLIGSSTLFSLHAPVPQPDFSTEPKVEKTVRDNRGRSLLNLAKPFTDKDLAQ
jgi:hypothetical protein